MKLLRSLCLGGLLLASITASLGAAAQDRSVGYPNRPVRFIIPFTPGQATDIIARMLAERLSQRWGQAVYVENKAGGNSVPGMLAGRDATPDGYTLTVAATSSTAVNEAIYPKLPYSMQRDFVPVAPVFTQAWLIVANRNAPYNNLNDLIAAAKKDPGKLSWTVSATALDLAGELVKQRAGIDILAVPYKGSPMAMTDIIGGHIDVGVDTMAAALPHIVFVIEIGEFPLHKHTIIAGRLRDNYHSYLYSLQDNDHYRRFATRFPFGAMRRLMFKIRGGNVSE